jgi:putative hydrolase of the HAD superfamily
MPILKPVNALIFDWGDTIMRDFNLPGNMAEWDKVEWIPGAELALIEASSIFLCVVATSAGNSGTPEMIAALKRVGADKYFDFFFSSKELGYNKPDPRFFIEIARLINLAPEECVMIGNRFEKDITGAKKAGMQTAFFNENNQAGTFPDADIIFTNFAQFTLHLLKLKP